LDRIAEALESFDRAIRLDPRSAIAHSNRGGTLHRLDRLENALESHDRSLALNPDLGSALVNRAQTLVELGRYDEALDGYERALALDPNSAEAEFGRATTLLIRGQFQEGWLAYERRRERVGGDAFHTEGRPQWSGQQDINGKTLFIEGEQGLGDMIQFCRYARHCADLGARVILTTRDSQVRLLQSLDRRIEVRGERDRPRIFDYHIALMSLPMALGLKESDLAGQVPYLHAEPAKVEEWRNRLGTNGYKVGICWQGGPNSMGRSFPLSLLADIGRRPDFRIISLLKGAGSEQLDGLPTGMAVELLGADYDAGPDGFIDAAAVMQNLDLVIACDTALAHLAGALARPVWVALKYSPDWRFMLGRQDSLFYPTMRLFRQDKLRDWPGVFAKISASLDQVAPR
jgi:tetratricopeptide (TPR) repeat protein